MRVQNERFWGMKKDEGRVAAAILYVRVESRPMTEHGLVTPTVVLSSPEKNQMRKDTLPCSESSGTRRGTKEGSGGHCDNCECPGTTCTHRVDCPLSAVRAVIIIWQRVWTLGVMYPSAYLPTLPRGIRKAVQRTPCFF